MHRVVYRFAFSEPISDRDVEETLALAVITAEILHGSARVRIDGAYSFDATKRTCVIDGTTAAGRDVSRLFAGLLGREYGEGAFTVRRIEATRQPESEEVPA